MKYPTPARFVTTLIFLFLTQLVLAQDNRDYTERSLEDLMNIEVTSVSKKSQKVSVTAAAIYVITQDEIRHSGALNIPDLLRMVPGVNVAQVSGNAWAISARGLNEHFSDKLLVMIDGRSVYTPTFSGVYWDGVDMPLENIERIEVIRGPGGSSWGANAVNGVINIITKEASQTHGGMIVWWLFSDQLESSLPKRVRFNSAVLF
jgi:iron complex outermembrane receptor protein